MLHRRTTSYRPRQSCSIAQRGEFTVHIPNIWFREARQAILTKCQPRNEAEAIRRFLARAERAGRVTKADATATRVVLDKYASSIKDLNNLEDTLQTLADLPCIEIYGLDDKMLHRATELALAGIAPKPFDHDILASVLVRASRLWDAGERLIEEFTLTQRPRRQGFE